MMRDETGTWLGGAVRVGAAFLLAGVGLAATTAIALAAVPGAATTGVVTVAPFLVGPPLAAAAGLTLTRGSRRNAALAGGVGALVGSYVLGAVALGTLAGVGGTPVADLAVSLLVAGLPAAVVGAGSGYLGAGGDMEPDHEPVVESATAPVSDSAPENVNAATADGGSDTVADDAHETETSAIDGSESAAAPPAVNDGRMDEATINDPSPGAVDMNAFVDGEDDEGDGEVSGLDDLFEKSDPIANDRG